MNDGLLLSNEGTNFEKILTDTFSGVAHAELDLHRVVQDIIRGMELFERHMNVAILYATDERKRKESMIHSLK